MATLIDKIELFEALDCPTVGEFNKLFIGNELKGQDDNALVEIGAIVGPDTTRAVTVGTRTFAHSFARTQMDVQTGSLKPEFTTNEGVENTMLTEKEMSLEPLEYVLLQYFRGSQSCFHTQWEIAEKLNKSRRGIQLVIDRMELKDVIKVEHRTDLKKLKIVLSEEWT